MVTLLLSTTCVVVVGVVVIAIFCFVEALIHTPGFNAKVHNTRAAALKPARAVD